MKPPLRLLGFRPGRPLRALLAVAALAFGVSTGFAQPQKPAPHLGYVYPAGGRIGTTFTVTVGGQNLNGATDAFGSDHAVTAKVVGYDRPMTQKEFNDLREKIQALQEKRAAALGLPPPPGVERKEQNAAAADAPKPAATDGPARKPETASTGDNVSAAKPTWTDEDQRQLAELRALLAKRPNRQGNPAIAESVTLEVTIAPGATAHDTQLRLLTPGGLSNPLVFQLGTLPEYVDPVVTATSEPAVRPKRDGPGRATKPRAVDPEVTLPVLINGQILPGEVDRYRFSGRRGQRVTVAASARSLLPYLADAVPGWFQATLALYDPDGRELAYSDSFRFNPDPVLNFELPRDGTYAIEIKDSIYRGREDFVYRIALGELPFITGTFPLGGKAAAPVLTGWNLTPPAPGSTTAGVAPEPLPTVRPLRALSNGQQALLEVDSGSAETEPNDRAESAQAITLPTIIDGRIDRVGDVDGYRFTGRMGQAIVAEVFARRLGSPLDSMLVLKDAAGHELAANDDTEDKGAGLITHHADSRIAVTLPADGAYILSISDAQHAGGPEFAYRLRVGAPRPDFELRVVPSAINARPGSHVPVTIYALRRDGFAGEIALALDDAPAEFGLGGARIPAGADHVQVTLAVPRNAPERVTTLALSGTASIEGRQRRHPAEPADDLMQAFAYHHLVPAQELLVAVVGRPAPPIRVATRVPVGIPAGGSTTLKLVVPLPRVVDNVAVELSDAPAGIRVSGSKLTGAGVDVTLTCDADAARKLSTPTDQAGDGRVRGNLILNLMAERPNPNAAKNQPKVQRYPLGTAPALPFEVMAEK